MALFFPVGLFLTLKNRFFGFAQHLSLYSCRLSFVQTELRGESVKALNLHLAQRPIGSRRFDDFVSVLVAYLLDGCLGRPVALFSACSRGSGCRCIPQEVCVVSRAEGHGEVPLVE